ncbi:MAG: tyrosine-type recombinase/integrase [Bacteroidales bacterium]|nr:tyrosine-type recombinase/integrase [Bacteroidales bacterium]
MTETEFKVLFPDGPCTDVCLDFLRFKRGLGQKFAGSDIYRLRDICCQMNQAVGEAPALSKETALDIAQRRNGESQGTQLNRIRVLRKLAEYMVSMDMDAYIIPRHFTQKYKYDFKPYIFSQEQITAILKAADQVKYCPCSPYAHIVIPAILRVFFGCGLRSSEARLLKVNRVNLDTGILIIEKSKNNVSRYVPMSGSLTVYLRKYAVAMGFDRVSDAYFFPSPTGGAYHDTTFRDRFRTLLS